MKIKTLLYGAIVVVYFTLFHLFFPPILTSGFKEALDTFLSDPLGYWVFIFPLFGFIMLGLCVILYGIYFLASFGRGFRAKAPYHAKISILIASKNEKALLERTLNTIVKSKYPLENIQIIIITSGSTDDSTDFCKNFAKEHSNIDIEVCADDLPKKGKPPALNYGLKYVKNDIVILYDSGCILQQDTLMNLVAPFQNKKIHAVIGPVLVKNWNTNRLTKGIFLDYTIVSGGGMLFEVKNRLGSSAFAFGRNFAVSTEYLKKYGGWNEDSMTEDLYLSVLLNLDGIDIKYSPKAKVYEYVPTTWDILVKQRSRWMAGFIYDAPQLMAMEGEKASGKSGKSIIISRNMTMMAIANMDTWMPIEFAFLILYFFIGEFYLFFWVLSCLIFQFGYMINGIRKYADKHYSILLAFLKSAYIHLFMFLRQFKLPKDISWEKTPMLLEKQEDEVSALSGK